MILLIEPNKIVRKRLCDMLNKERIVYAESLSETLEMIVKFKSSFNIIISNIRILENIVSSGSLFRLCEKLYIQIPPLLGIYRKGDEKIKEKFQKYYSQYKLVEYDKDDNGFPERYIKTIQDLYPEIIVDIEEANKTWLRGEEPEPAVDPRKWLVEQGFLEAIESSKLGKLAKDMEEIIPLIKKILLTEETTKKQTKRDIIGQVNYKQMYFDLKEKHEELLRYVSELIDYIKRI